MQAYIEALRTVHFEECPVQASDAEPGYEKFAIFHKAHAFTQIAIISGENAWKSKLGNFEDIEHPEPLRRKMGAYGLIFKYLRREIRYAGDPLPDEYKL